MGVIKAFFNLVKQVINPKNYMLLDRNQELTKMPDTLILDNSGRVRVDYNNEEVRRRVGKVFSDLQEFQSDEAASSGRAH